MKRYFLLEDITVEVIPRDIKHLYLTIHPPDGAVIMKVPLRIDRESIEAFASKKLDWIKKQRKKIREQKREVPRQYIDHECHYLWGECYSLRIVEAQSTPRVWLEDGEMILQIRPNASFEKKCSIVDQWYRQILEQAIPSLIEKWEGQLSVAVSRFTIIKMKTKWGSCTPSLKKIRFNLELAKKPCECLEYVVVHEMVHLLEPTHNKRFYGLMDQFMPEWRSHRVVLNAPLDQRY